MCERGHFLNIHHDRSLTGDINHQRIRMRDLHAHRRRQPIAHGAKPARGHPAIGLIKAEILRGPHLVLTNFGGDEGLAPQFAGDVIKPLHRMLRLDDFAFLPILQAIRAAPRINLAPPGGNGAFVLRRFIRLPGFNHGGEHRARIAHNRHIHRDILVNGGWINICMDLLGRR